MKKILGLFVFAALSLMVLSPVSFCAEKKTACAFVRVTTNLLGYNFIVKKVAQGVLKKTLKDAMDGDYKVKFDSFSGVDLKKGKFKALEITGDNLSDGKMYLSHLDLKTTSDYNYVDYKKNPLVFKTDLPMDFNLEFTESDLNKNINEVAGVNFLCSVLPLVKIEKPTVKIEKDKIKLQSSLKMPLAKKVKFSMSSGLKVVDGKLTLSDVESSGNSDFAGKLVELVNKNSLLEEMNLPLFDNSETVLTVKNVSIKNKKVYINGNLLIKKSE